MGELDNMGTHPMRSHEAIVIPILVQVSQLPAEWRVRDGVMVCRSIVSGPHKQMLMATRSRVDTEEGPSMVQGPVNCHF